MGLFVRGGAWRGVCGRVCVCGRVLHYVPMLGVHARAGPEASSGSEQGGERRQLQGEKK